MAANTVIRITLIQTMQGQFLNNQLHFSAPDSDPARMTGLSTEVNTTWVTAMRTQQTSDLRYVGIKAQILESQFAPQTLALNLTGNGGGNDNDKTTYCHIVRIKTPLIGKHNRGRVYVGGIANNADNKSFLDSGRLTSWATQLTNVMNVFGPAGSSVYRIGVTRKVSPTANWVAASSLEMNPQYGIQRRRKVGIGI